MRGKLNDAVRSCAREREVVADFVEPLSAVDGHPHPRPCNPAQGRTYSSPYRIFPVSGREFPGNFPKTKGLMRPAPCCARQEHSLKTQFLTGSLTQREWKLDE